MKALIQKLHKDVAGRVGSVPEQEFARDIRAKIIELAGNSEHINFAGCFEEIDLVLSIVESFVGKGDKVFDDSHQKLVQLLDGACSLDERSKSLSDIASMQNFDGSFCHSSQLKKKYLPIALERFINDSDSFLYKKQTSKLVEYFRRTNPGVLAKYNLD